MKTHLLEALAHTERYDPHRILGLHRNGSESVIRLYRPEAAQVFIELYGYIVEMKRVHDSGLFELSAPADTTFKDYRVYHTDGSLTNDPYAFWPTFGEVDQYLFGAGVHYEIHRKMGARPMLHQGVQGVAFTVWAPSARSVSLIGDFNHWDGRVNPMRSLGSSGVWELFVPGLPIGSAYKFEIQTQTGDRRIKSDPYGHQFEHRPKTASLVCSLDSYEWNDQEWLEARKSQNLNRPINIYEVHLGSWRRGWQNEFLGYRYLASELATYCKEMGYTHVELLPISEHPLDESWGYQVTGFFAPSSRFGSLEDFQYFVDTLHQNGIGVILDWVPGHFPTDDFALARFDGTSLYEHVDARKGFHPHWNTCIFNFGRHEVSNFLLASALFWLDVMHIDGLRVDAVASMLYLDYGREDGRWIPNEYGGKENIEAIEFLKHANAIIHDRFPGVLTIAEESTSFTGISHPLSSGGVGFDFKWNMGWMNDTLRYIQKDPIHRAHHQNELTFSLLYAFSERFVLVLSHDEVVHGKKSLLAKMPGDVWQQFANMRLILGYLMTQPGKKLLFMGAELGQWNEWDSAKSLEWFLLQFPIHSGLQTCCKELNHLYLERKELWADDFTYHGFSWVDFSDSNNSIITFLRKDPATPQKALLVLLHFSPQYFERYTIQIGNVSSIREIFNTDEERFGGSGKVNGPVYIGFGNVTVSVAPLACQVFEIHF